MAFIHDWYSLIQALNVKISRYVQFDSGINVSCGKVPYNASVKEDIACFVKKKKKKIF